MNIFTDIKHLIFEQDHDFLELREQHRLLVYNFLDKPSASNAKKLFVFVQRVHKKEVVFSLMDDLHIYESGISKILPDLREHYFHSACVYVVGLALYNVSRKLREVVVTTRHEVTDVSMQKASFLFRWSLAACLHDLAYPLELSLRTFNKYNEKLNNESASYLKIDENIYEKFNFLPILDVHRNANEKDTALGLIAYRISQDRARCRVTYETLYSLLVGYIKRGLASGRIDHGVFSAFITLKRIHGLYEIKTWNSQDYYCEVVDSCTAIFLHNVYKFSVLKDIYGEGKYRFDYPSPLGYLLFVSDTMCEWMRSRKNDANLFRLVIEGDNLLFQVHSKYKNNIESSAKMFDERLGLIVQYYE